MKNLLLGLTLLITTSYSLLSQTVFTSTCGYSVTVYIKPMDLVFTSYNDYGFNYKLRIKYDAVYNRPITNYPAEPCPVHKWDACGSKGSLYNFQVQINCLITGGQTHGAVDIPMPNYTNSGVVESTGQYIGSDIILKNDATVNSLKCSEIKVRMSGPGMPNTIKTINPGALPIELISFDAIAKENHVDLSWVSGSEKNNDFFTIERTVDGFAYEEVVKVPGQGNSSTKTDYHYTDLRPVTGVSFYRLKQTDYNGESAYFDVKSVNIERQGSVSNVYPNPTVLNRTTVFIAQAKTNVTLNVRNILGQILFSKEVDSKSKDVYEEIEFTESGKLFIVEVVQNDVIIARHKVIKN